jgi:ATP-dependent RNA helicase SUPV3L1/SUV3
MDNKFEPRRDDRGGRFGDRAEREDRGPRLGDVAFRAQRDALEHAQIALKKLAAQAHGEALTQLLTAWEQRAADQVPSPAGTGPRRGRGRARRPGCRRLAPRRLAMRQKHCCAWRWPPRCRRPPSTSMPGAALQLQLLTRRNDPSPAQTWGQDAAKVLASAHDAQAARRLQNVLKALLRG